MEAEAADKTLEEFVRDAIPHTEDEALRDAAAYIGRMRERLEQLKNVDQLQLACDMRSP
jgi:hypothetical protein